VSDQAAASPTATWPEEHPGEVLRKLRAEGCALHLLEEAEASARKPQVVRVAWPPQPGPHSRWAAPVCVCSWVRLLVGEPSLVPRSRDHVVEKTRAMNHRCGPSVPGAGSGSRPALPRHRPSQDRSNRNTSVHSVERLAKELGVASDRISP